MEPVSAHSTCGRGDSSSGTVTQIDQQHVASEETRDTWIALGEESSKAEIRKPMQILLTSDVGDDFRRSLAPDTGPHVVDSTDAELVGGTGTQLGHTGGRAQRCGDTHNKRRKRQDCEGSGKWAGRVEREGVHVSIGLQMSLYDE